ncbi:MAG: hypothetical protein JRH12_21920 [Deltaproteobacteria bacterium]|jgi:hypothetical protein|nr:hypothetical protein [Deltaproteobacteria bacterium]MBW2481384.1 hypothetical protein [Deltaproteobacteria bacterium]
MFNASGGRSGNLPILNFPEQTGRRSKDVKPVFLYGGKEPIKGPAWMALLMSWCFGLQAATGQEQRPVKKGAVEGRLILSIVN